jgi:hypothetical protein
MFYKASINLRCLMLSLLLILSLDNAAINHSPMLREALSLIAHHIFGLFGLFINLNHPRSGSIVSLSSVRHRFSSLRSPRPLGVNILVA